MSDVLDIIQIIKEENQFTNKSYLIMDSINNYELLGKCISALANTAVIRDKLSMYLISGINENGEICGIQENKLDENELNNHLIKGLSAKAKYDFQKNFDDGKEFIIVEVQRAIDTSIQYKGNEYILIDNELKFLKDNIPETKDLWKKLDGKKFEDMIALDALSSIEVLELLDFNSFNSLLHIENKSINGTLLDLKSWGFIIEQSSGKFAITNLGAILFARKIKVFKKLIRKAVRVVVYQTTSKVDGAKKEIYGEKGYANGFEGLLKYIISQLATKEVIGSDGIRKNKCLYPELAIRELVANMLIHQDFNSPGDGPIIEIYPDRVEFSNPGKALIDVNRFIDHPPKSRNEILASVMRKIGICEERGSGIDKVIYQTEKQHLPAPLIIDYQDSIRVTLFSYKAISDWSKEDKIKACYYHACLQFVNGSYLTNSSLRERLNIEEKQKYYVTRIINDSINAGFIIALDKETAPKYMKYIPCWAK